MPQSRRNCAVPDSLTSSKNRRLAQLEQTLQPYLHLLTIPQIAIGTAPATRLLDDDAALAAIGGNAEALHALRGLLAQELAALLAESANATPGASCSTWRENLHRLRASCGFCGATALAEAAVLLDRGLRDDPDNVQPILGGFLHLCRVTKAASCNQEPASADGERASESIPHARKATPSR